MIQTHQDNNKDTEDDGDNFIINPAGLNEVLNQADDDEQFNAKQPLHDLDNRKNTVFTSESTQHDNMDTNHGFLRSRQSIHAHITKRVVTHADLFQRHSSIDSPASISSPSHIQNTSHDEEGNALVNPKRSRNVQLRANAMNRLMRSNIDSIGSIDQEDSPSIISSVVPSMRGQRRNISQSREGLLRQMTDKTDGTIDFSRKDIESEIADRELIETIERARFSDFNFKSFEITPRSATGSMTSLNRKELVTDFGMQSNIEKRDPYTNSINVEYISKRKTSDKSPEKAPKQKIKVKTTNEANDEPRLNVVEQGFVLEIHSGTLNNNLESPNFKKRRVDSQPLEFPEKKQKKKKSKSKSKKSDADGTEAPTEGKKKKSKKHKTDKTEKKPKNKSPVEAPANPSEIEISSTTRKKDGILVIDIEADENSKGLQRQQTPETEVTADTNKNQALNEDMMLGLNVVSYFKHRLIPLRNKIYYAIVIALFLASFGTNLMEIILLGTSECTDYHNKFFVYANIAIIFFVKIGIFNFVTFEVSGNPPLDIKYPFLIPVLSFGIFPIMQMPQFIYNWRECQYHNDIFTLDFAFVIVNVFGIAILSLFALFIGLAFFCAGCKVPNNAVKVARNIGYFVALCVFIGINVINLVMQFTQFTSFVTGYFLEILPFWFFLLSGLIMYILRKFKGFQMFKTIQELEVEEKESNPLQNFGAKRGELLPIVSQDGLNNHPETLGSEDKENGAAGLSTRNKANITFGEKSVR